MLMVIPMENQMVFQTFFGDEKEVVTFDAIENFFLIVIHVTSPMFCPSLHAETKHEKRKN